MAADRPRPRRPKPALLTDEGGREVSAHVAFPARHRAAPRRADFSKCPDGEVKRRADVAGTSPGEAAIARPIGAVPLEAGDERRTDRRPMRPEGAAEPAAEAEPAQVPPRAA